MESGHSSSNNPVINLSKAVKDVQKGSSITVAAANHNIPISILFNRVSAIRQLKKKKLHSEMQSSTNETPDKYGLVVNEKHFRNKFSTNRKFIYVNQLYYNAIHFALEGNSIDDTVLNFKVKRKTLQRKLSDVKAYRKQQQSSSNHKPSRNRLAERRNEKLPSLYHVMKNLVENCGITLPEKFISAMNYTQKGESFENVAAKFSFDITSFSKVARMLRLFQKLPLVYLKTKSNIIQSSLPSIHPSFSSINMSKDETLECLQIYFSKGGRRSYDYEALRNALREIANGLSVAQASKLYSIPFSTLRDKAVKKNIYNRERDSPRKKEVTSHDENEISLIHQKSPSPIKSKIKRSQPLCLFCHQPGYREEEIGKLHILNKVIVHYYCLLFSCALEQNGDDDEGILGFLPKDIIKEINRGKRLKCTHCGLKGATIGCSYRNCKRVYHFPCGLDNFAQFIFTDNFSSMCSKHRKYQNGQGKGLTMDCPICLESMEADPRHAVYPPCCKRSSWFHKKCIQKLALSAGYFFKCPLCNDKNIFTSEMLRQGIFVPDQDASWELVPNAYQELLERPIRCTAPVCKCPSGRNSDEEGTRWEVLLCYYCGSTGIHISCGNLKASSTEWHCPTCIAMLKERSEREEKDTRRVKAQALKRKKCHLGEEIQDISDEENSDNYSSKRQCPDSTNQSPSSRKRLPQQPCSSNLVITLDSDDQIVPIPRGIRGHIVIKDLIQKNEPLTDALQEMKQYAENLSQKLVDCKIEKMAFINLLNTTNSSSSHSRKRYIIDETHVQKFEECSLNYDQMRFLRNVFELGFALFLRKSKLSSTLRAAKLNPFCRKKRRYKDVLQVKESLLNLLIKARSANLLEGNSTWSSYGNRQKNAYFNKVNGDLPSTSNESEIGSSESGHRLTSHSSRNVCPIRLMESEQISEDCMWCNMELLPGIHPTTFKKLKFRTVTLSVICTSCLTDNIFYNVFSSFASSSPYCSRLKVDDIKQNSVKSDIVDSGDRKETNMENKKSQSKIFEYFVPLAKSESKSDDMKPMSVPTMKLGRKSESKSDDMKLLSLPTMKLGRKSDDMKSLSLPTMKLDDDISTSKNVGIKLKETQNSNDNKQPKEVKELPDDDISTSKNVGIKLKETPNSNNNKQTKQEKELPAKKGNSSPLNPTPSTSASLPLNLINVHASPTKIVNSDNRKQTENVESSISELGNDNSDNNNSVKPKLLTQNLDTSTSTLSSGKCSRNKDSNGSDIIIPVKDKDSSKSQLDKKTDDSPKSQLDKKTDDSPPSSTITCNKNIDNPSKVNVSEKVDSNTTSELRNLRPINTNNSVKISSESKTATTSDASPSTSTSLRSVRTKEKSSSTTVASTNNNNLSTSAPRQIVLSRSEVLKNMPRHSFESKSENNTSGRDNLSKVKISEPEKPAPSKEYIRNNFDKHSKEEPSKCGSVSSDLKVLENTQKSCPPVHQPMEIISSSVKVCTGCKMSLTNGSLWKKSKIYCPCCKDVPTFCDKKHFEYYHSQTHHWATIPPNDGILRPVRKCGVCTKCEFTRFYCPACPGNFGYCSHEHYIQNHKDQKSKAKLEASKCSKKNNSESSPGKKSSSNSGVTSKSLTVSDLQNLKSKVKPQTLTLSAFNFPSMSRRIDLNEALGPSANSGPSANADESLKGVRISRSTHKEQDKS